MREVNTIYKEDCVSFIQALDNKSVDLIIADPPYNLGKDFGNKSDHWENVEGWFEWCKQWINECIRVLKPSGSIFIYGIHRFICHIHCYLYEKDLIYQRQIIWYYENGFSGYKTLNAFYEPILWFTKSKDFTYHEIREPYKSQERLKNKITKNGKVWQSNPKGRLAGDIWKFPTLAGKRFSGEKVDHPTQKPLALCDRLIQHFSNEEDLVLIPFAGSGSECVSSLANNRKFIASEINPRFVKIANERLADIQHQIILTQ